MSPPTVGRLLKGLGYSLRVNAKQIEAASNHPERNQQFEYIADQRAEFTRRQRPILSIDSKKKKELVGNFKNTGQAWVCEPTAVNVHDFPGDALGRAVPYGVYDLTNNRGFVYLGSSGDTPAFAADAIAAWWQTEGQLTWPTDDHLLLPADAGGSNSCRTRAWKERLQVRVCDRFGLTVTVCHYPTGRSKWNPIERRLFSHISNNWAGVPLRTWDTLLAFIRGTTTAHGLAVHAIFDDGNYPTGQQVTDAEMATLRIEPHAICPQIGVGTGIAARPLHRSRRAELPHRAPALRHDDKQFGRIRLHYLDSRYPARNQRLHPLPVHFASLAAAR